MNIKWIFYIINISSWVIFLYLKTAQTYGYKYGEFFVKSYVYNTGLISLLFSTFLMFEYYAFWQILISLLLTLIVSAIFMGILRSYSQILSLIGILFGYISLIYLKINI